VVVLFYSVPTQRTMVGKCVVVGLDDKPGNHLYSRLTNWQSKFNLPLMSLRDVIVPKCCGLMSTRLIILVWLGKKE
jgi:hypothetical protein